MERLRKLLSGYEEYADGKFWFGLRPDGPDEQLQILIAGEIGYPNVEACSFPNNQLKNVTRDVASKTLAYAGTVSLAYEGLGHLTDNAIRQATAAIAAMDANAKFFVNGDWVWGYPNVTSWMEMTDATFQCGIIGYDDKNAFIYWVEEED